MSLGLPLKPSWDISASSSNQREAVVTKLVRALAIAAGIVIAVAGAGTAVAAGDGDTVTVAIVAGAYK